ncbi:MAG TPA: glycoside hydrolase family 20 zincin-like fold domain-containing protein, partial [Gemmatirosa sp.]
MPREISARGTFAFTRGVSVVAGPDAEDRFTARELTEALRDRRVPIAPAGVAGVVTVRLLRRDTPEGRDALRRSGLALDTAMIAEGYVLTAEPATGGVAGRVEVVAANGAGLFYGAQTVAQLIDGDGPRARLLSVRIRDWPAVRWRGLHDDLSRGSVPTLEFQKQQIRTLAAYKVNVYSPYFEHTLAYASNPLPAPPGGVMTRDDARELAAYARRYHVEIIPEQQSFGHLHHFFMY